MIEPMTPRARWFAALHAQPVDCLPFWPKIFDETYSRVQAPPFRDMPIPTLWNWLGCDLHVPLAACIKEVRTRTSVESETNNGSRKTTYTTPNGTLRATDHWDFDSGSWYPVEFPVKRREDIAIMAEVFSDVRIELDKDMLAKNKETIAQMGEAGTSWSGLGRSPLMNWLEFIAGIEGGQYLLADYTDEVEALFETMQAVLLRSAEVLTEKSPVDVLYMIEDTSTTYVSPRQYNRYCKPQITEYCEIVRSAGRLMMIHMCGHLKGLLPLLATMPANGFEAFTSPPVGNTTLVDGRTNCPDKVLVGGTNAALWLEPADRIIAEIAADLDALPHHRGIVISSAGMMPPGCQPETIKQVCDWVHSYPARMG